MSATRLLPLALVALAATLGTAAFSQEGTLGTGVDERDGWKGLPGAKDPGEPGKSPGWVEVELKAQAVEKDWPCRTPLDAQKIGSANVGAWIDVSNGILPLGGVRGSAIKFEPRTGKIFIDADGCGQLCTPISGEVQAVTNKCPDGSQGAYWFRLRRDDKQYIFARMGMAVGKIDGTPVAFIDENDSGCYGDVGYDAVRIGGAPCAQYMSDVLNVKNKLYYVRVNQAGSKAWYKPYDGPTGKTDLASQYKGKSKPLFAMLKQGEVIVDAAAKDTVIPAGQWTLYEGLVGPSMFRSAKIKSGKMSAIEVKAGATASLAWGMQGVIEFDATKNGNQLVIRSSSIRIFGQAGEEYVNFRPRAFTPDAQAIDKSSGKEVYRGNMGFGC